MADSSDPFESSGLLESDTTSSIPDSWEQDSNTETVFAWLRPMNEFARHAFHLLVDSMIQNPGSRKLERKFIHLEGRGFVDTSSVSSSDDQADQEATD